jgi:hypothetical protein
VTNVRLKYIHCFTDRHGRARYYFRHRGQRWSIPAPGSSGFATAYDALLAQIKANSLKSRHTIEFMPGSLAWAIEKFLASPPYSKRAETTKRNYRRVLDQLREKYGTRSEAATRQNDAKRNSGHFHDCGRHGDGIDLGALGLRDRAAWIGARRRSDAWRAESS